MKILFINTVYGTGSTGRIVARQYKKLKSEGHECMVAYGRGEVPNNINSYRIGTNLSVYAHAFLTRLTDKTGLYSKIATKRFLNQIDMFKPDCVYLHNLHGYYLNYELLFAYLKERKIPIVWTLHDCWTFTGHCANFEYVGCDKWRTGCGNCPQKKSYPATYVFDNSQSNYKKKMQSFTGVQDMSLIVPSNWLEGLVKQSFLKNYPVKMIHNDVDLSMFKPIESNIREKYGIGERIILLGVANVWTKSKGLDDFIKLADIIDKEKYQLILVGLNKKQIKQLSGKMIAIGRTESVRELAELYTAADYYLNLTYGDNYPTTNLEAKACGTPVISYDTGGSVESADMIIKKGDLAGIKQIVSKKP